MLRTSDSVNNHIEWVETVLLLEALRVVVHNFVSPQILHIA